MPMSFTSASRRPWRLVEKPQNPQKAGMACRVFRVDGIIAVVVCFASQVEVSVAGWTRPWDGSAESTVCADAGMKVRSREVGE
ncbi:hypothetical protein ColLi_11427 [Colletotrichum liriopes]|uniref:Uncharacterized protein n=1 Tax=Colletotrichum liriopes TaxID=708192 RepID=A0AA37GWG2_9PEZI|nr:hypothetical protein ColLi_11427 [Colletotrichum liriopes]